MDAPEHMAFYSYIRWELDEWAVVGLVILFILQALILWSLRNRARQKRFDRESKRLALLATEGHRRLDEEIDRRFKGQDEKTAQFI